MQQQIKNLEKDFKKFKKSYLETNLTTIFFNSILRTIIVHLAQIDKNFTTVAPTYIKLSTEGINEYINKNCPLEAKEFCKTFVNGLQEEYLKLIKDIEEVKNEKDSTN